MGTYTWHYAHDKPWTPGGDGKHLIVLIPYLLPTRCDHMADIDIEIPRPTALKKRDGVKMPNHSTFGLTHSKKNHPPSIHAWVLRDMLVQGFDLGPDDYEFVTYEQLYERLDDWPRPDADGEAPVHRQPGRMTAAQREDAGHAPREPGTWGGPNSGAARKTSPS